MIREPAVGGAPDAAYGGVPVRLPRRVPSWPRAALAALLVATGCRGWRGDTYYAHLVPAGRARKEATYRFGDPGAGWRPLRDVKDVQVAWMNVDLGAVIEIHAQCDEQGDSSLEQYTDHLRIDWTDWTIVSQERKTIIGRAALHTVVTAKLDGVPRKNEFIVVKKSGCLFDLRLSSRPDAFAQASADFGKVVAGFKYPLRERAE